MLTKANDFIFDFQLATINISELATSFLKDININLDSSIINVIAALIVILVGFLLSAIAASATKQILKRIQLDERIASKFRDNSGTLDNFQLEQWVPIGVFCILFGITLIAFLETLKFRQFTSPINAFLKDIYGYLPSLGAAAILLAIAWLLANGLRLAVSRGLDTLRLEERLNNQIESNAEENKFSLKNTISQAIYWFVLLFFVPIILDTLGFQSTLDPVEKLVAEFLLYLPNILSATLIGVIGWFAAKAVSQITSNFLASVGIDRLGAKFGMSTNRQSSLSWLGGTFAAVVILIYTAIAILNKLNIEAISKPAIVALSQVFTVLPQVFTAVAILAIGYIAGKYAAEFLTSFLTSINFNNFFFWLGLPIQQSQFQNNSTTKTPSEIAGIVAMVGIMLFATISAIDVLNLTALTALMQGLIIVFGSILAGLFVLAIGLYLANLAFNLIITSGVYQARILAQTARVIIIAFVGTMALQQIGIATNIVNLAFGLSLGAISVSVALAIGLGTREIAGGLVKQWLKELGIRS
ncbi:MAG: mechanosensitive ion channel [Rivularia sp. (in: Bacteria)]|nr:mechanosensitive ion channel [Rivularia sp. MS3]